MYEVRVSSDISIRVQFEPATVASEVKERLKELGLSTELDDKSLSKAQARAEETIRSFINKEVLPLGLFFPLIDEIAADLIAARKAEAFLDADGKFKEGEATLKDIREGDVSYSFAQGSSEQHIVTGIETIEQDLRRGRETWWHYRSLAW